MQTRDAAAFIANQLFNATATMLVCISQICCYGCANFWPCDKNWAVIILTDWLKYGKLLLVAEDMQCATVAQLVEQLTRNEQVACSNQVSSSNMKDPEKWLVA